MQRIGDYSLVEKIGAGGMGEVWLAENVHTRLRYAVKLLPLEATKDRNFVARFFDEGRVMAQLDHPRIVRVHHVGHDKDSGRYYLVMDHVEGPQGKPQSLHNALEQSPESRLPEAQARKWALQIAEALAHAHSHGVVHRDIKPANIMVDKEGNARITDFGLAKAIGEGFVRTQIHQSIELSMRGTLSDTPTIRSTQQTLSDQPTISPDDSKASHHTTAKSLLGTYDYMSPEQRGELSGVEVGPASDVYAFGVMLYRILTGRRPTGRAKPASELVPGLAKSWDQVIDRCLEHKPADRHANGDQLLTALKGAVVRIRWSRRVVKMAVCVAVLIVVVLAGRLVWASYRNYQSHQTQLRQQAAQDAQTQRQVEALRSAVSSALTSGDLQTAGAKLSDLEQVGRKQAASDLRNRYESLAGERETNQRYAAALVARDQAMKLEHGQGFAAKLEALEVTWREGEAARQDKSWGQALTAYDGVIAQGAALTELDTARHAATDARLKADAARQRAAGENAAQDAPTQWKDAETRRTAAGESFEKGDSAAASQSWQQALSAYEAAQGFAQAVQRYNAARSAYEKGVSNNQSLLDAHGGAQWQEVLRQSRIGAASANDPAAGAVAYVKASDELPAAIAEAEKANAAAALQARIWSVEQVLEQARSAQTAGNWQQVHTILNELTISPSELGDQGRRLAEEKSSLLTEAGRHLVPSLKIVVEVEGREVSGATVKSENQTWQTPTTRTLEKGREYSFEVSYAAPGGKRYGPERVKRKADWTGEQTLRIPLAEHCLSSDLVEVTAASYASLDGLASGSREAQERQRRAVSELSLPLEVMTAKTGIVFRLIPAGTFTMGSPANEAGRKDNEEPQHSVTLSNAFYCGKHEVTQAQWEAVTGNNPSYFKNAGGDAPVESVSWEDCQAFLKKLCQMEGTPEGTYRLLTEAEWEYACRAGTTTALYNGNLAIQGVNNGPALDSVAWYGGNSGVQYAGGVDSSKWLEKQYGHSTAGTHPAGHKAPNGYGLHDMIGNVWEWCQDRYGPYESGSVTDPSGPASGDNRVRRGGGWGGIIGYYRSANRYAGPPTDRFNLQGLRLARTTQSYPCQEVARQPELRSQQEVARPEELAKRLQEEQNRTKEAEIRGKEESGRTWKGLITSSYRPITIGGETFYARFEEHYERSNFAYDKGWNLDLWVRTRKPNLISTLPDKETALQNGGESRPGPDHRSGFELDGQSYLISCEDYANGKATVVVERIGGSAGG